MVTVTDVAFTDQYTGSMATPSPFIIGNVTDKIQVVVTYEVHWESINIPVNLVTTGGINYITRQDCPVGNFDTDGYLPGDTIVLTGCGANNGSYTIISVTSDYITVSAVYGFSAPGNFANASIYGTTPILAMDFYYLLSQSLSDNNFKSLSDNNNIQRLTGTAPTSYTTSSLSPYGIVQDWWEGANATLDYVGTGSINAYSRKYTITYTLEIKPTFLAGQLSALQQNFIGGSWSPPDYLSGMGFVFMINARYAVNNQNVGQTSQGNVTFYHGNIGWYNQNLDSPNVNYSLDANPIYTHHVGADVITSLDYGTDTDVSIIIDSAHSTFVNNSSKVNLLFSALPASPGQYQNKSLSYPNVFVEDSVLLTVGSAAANGGNYGGNYQVIKSAQATFISTSKIQITFTCSLGSQAKAILSQLGNNNYMIVASPQDPSITHLSTTDRVAVLCDVNYGFTNTAESILTIITDSTTDVHFFKYPANALEYPIVFTNYRGTPGEYGYAVCDFQIASGYILSNITVNINAVPSLGYSFPIETWTNNTSQFYNGTNAGNISVYNTRGFPMPATANENIRSIARLPNQDYGGSLAYKLIYGFQCRMAWWEQLVNYNPVYNAYPTQYWPVYTQGGSSLNILPAGVTTQIQFQIVWQFTNPTTGNVTSYVRNSNFSINDQNQNFNSYSCAITTQDNVGNDLGGIVASDVQTQVTATFTGTGVGNLQGGHASFIAWLIFTYTNGAAYVYDFAANDFLNDPSLWIAMPVLTVVNANQVKLVGILDLTRSKLQITCYELTATLQTDVNS